MKFRSKIPPKRAQKQVIQSNLLSPELVKMMKDISTYTETQDKRLQGMLKRPRTESTSMSEGELMILFEDLRAHLVQELMPTDEHLESIVAALLPDVTDSYLRSLIKPLIPNVKDGYTPVKGKDYFDGKNGYTPIKGEDYFDGRSVTPEELIPTIQELLPNDIATKEQVKSMIVAAIAKAKSKEDKPINVSEIANTVTEKVVATLDEKLKTLRAEMRQISSGAAFGGGGMGTIKFFKFTGDNSTTAFTLPDVPTQEGSAVFAFSGGQRLHNNEQFTVSGRTLTTTFTPLSGEIIDGYIIT